MKAGGIGIRRSTQLAPSAYLASAAGCSDLVQQILPPHLGHNVSHSHHYDAALSLWAEDHSHPPPSQPSASRQREWDAPKVEASLRSIWDLAISDVAKACLLAFSCTESGAWLNALPLSSIGLRMDDDVVRIAVGLRLGLPLCSPHTYSGCGGGVQEDGIHGLSCRYSRGCHSQHAALNDIVKRSLDAAKIPSHLEPSGLYRGDGKLLDGASVVPLQRGKILVWDATCLDTLAPSHQDIAVREPGAAAAAAEHRKRRSIRVLRLQFLWNGILPYKSTKYRTHRTSCDRKYMFAGSL